MPQITKEVGATPQKPEEIPADPKALMRRQDQQESGHALFEINEKNALQKKQALKALGLRPLRDQGMHSGFKVQQEDIQGKIPKKQKTIDQRYQGSQKKHEEKADKSLLFVATKQEALHVWDLVTHGYDGVWAPLSRALGRIFAYCSHSEGLISHSAGMMTSSFKGFQSRFLKTHPPLTQHRGRI